MEALVYTPELLVKCRYSHTRTTIAPTSDQETATAAGRVYKTDL